MEFSQETLDYGKSLLKEAFWRFSQAKIPVERCVIVEKYKKHDSGLFSPPNIGNHENIEDDEYGLHFRPRNKFMEFCWCNSAGQLHSFNDMPSRIFFDSYTWIKVEWHKNGEPYRKNFKFNQLIIKDNNHYPTIKNDANIQKNTELYWLNKKGQVHSFNDTPAVITHTHVAWYNKGIISRRSYNQLCSDLPCYISSTGDMEFSKNKDDTKETLRYPLSNKYYGKAAVIGLNQYEKYVQWPIRDLLTL